MKTTNIVSVSAFLDDPAAAALEGGSILAALEAERIVRVKKGTELVSGTSLTTNERMTPVWTGEIRHFPSRCIEEVIQGFIQEPPGPDSFAFGFDLQSICHGREEYQDGFPGLPSKVLDYRLTAFNSYISHLSSLASDLSADLHFVRHHKAHAYGAAFASPFDRATVVTMDGMGEFESATAWAFDGQELEELFSVPLPHSIGRVYSSVTQYLGFRQNRDEQKVMALAGYGEPTFVDRLRKLVRTTEDGFEIEPEHFWTKECGMGFTNPSPLPDVFGAPARKPGEDPMKDPYPDVARSLQEILFEVSSHLVEKAYEQTGYGNLALSGGVALNCENNGRLLTELGFVDDVFVQPQAHDAGVALGAAYAVHHEETGERPEPMEHVFYGPEFGDGEIEPLLSDWKWRYEETGDPAGEAAERIADGEVVGWFQGRMEAGPRALGARSILAAPSGEDASRYVNEKVKDRETWRPFAPTILDGYRDRYLDVDVRDPFMTLALPVTDRARDELADAVHVTGTTRPQTLTEEFNPLYHQLVHSYRKETGIPAVMNTSFNVSGEPIVCRPEEGLVDFAQTGMDTLVIGSFVVTKDD